MESIFFKIYGQVQGVFFREFVRKQAVDLGLVGYVKNCNDGTVEVSAEGSRKKLENLKIYCKKGPPSAKVEKVEEVWGEVEKSSFDEFRIY